MWLASVKPQAFAISVWLMGVWARSVFARRIRCSTTSSPTVRPVAAERELARAAEMAGVR